MRIITFGEIMLRLATPGFLRLNQTPVLEMTFGGSEANVAVSLALWGENAAFVTRLPRNDVAETCIQQLRGLGVDTTKILRGGERMGIYFLETGASQRASAVTYDRSHSAISEIDPAELDWPTILQGADWFHFTGITPALSDGAARATHDGARAAKKLGLTVSCDLNFRKKLWSGEKAGRVMRGMMEQVDVCFANEEAAEQMLGVKVSGTHRADGKIDYDRQVEIAAKLTERYRFKGVANSLRESFSATRNSWAALYFTGGKAHFSRRYDMHIVDRVGGGDSFAAGLIYALSQKRSAQDAIEFAAAAGCLKHSISGDFSLIKLEEVEALMAGDGSGRVQR